MAPDHYLDDLSFFEGKLLFCSIRIWGHGEGVVVKQSHKDAGRELLGTRVSFRFVIEVWRKAVSPGVLIWSMQGTEHGGYVTPVEQFGGAAHT